MRLLLVLLLLSASTAQAAPRRFAIVVGANHGAASHPPLRFAESDAQKIYNALTEVTGVDYDDAILLRSPREAELSAAFATIRERIIAHKKAAKDPSMFVFYYSGHSDGVALELGSERFANDALQKQITATDADLKLSVLDACHAGALIQSKGAIPAGYVMNLSETPAIKGQITLSASSATELALESREVGGSFFTHHLVSGLRGAADASQDGRVTLAELYPYTYQQTLKATSSTTVGVQHPGVDMKLKGNGEVVLADIRQASATLVVGQDLSQVLVIDRKADAVVAEVGAAKKLSLEPGNYLLRMNKEGVVSEARVTLASREVRRVDAAAFKQTAAIAVASRGRAVVEVNVSNGGGPVEPPSMTETKVEVSPRVVVVPARPKKKSGPWHIAASSGVQASWVNTMPVIVPIRLAFELGDASAFSLVAQAATNTGLSFRETWGLVMAGYGFGVTKSFFTFRGSLLGGIGFATQTVSSSALTSTNNTGLVFANELSFLFRFAVHERVAIDASFDAPINIMFSTTKVTPLFMPQGRVGLSFKL